MLQEIIERIYEKMENEEAPKEMVMTPKEMVMTPLEAIENFQIITYTLKRPKKWVFKAIPFSGSPKNVSMNSS